jgi:hypothetical protein
MRHGYWLLWSREFESISQLVADNKFVLNPNLFPKPLELTLSDESLVRLEKLAARTGRSLSEVATDLLARSLSATDPSWP